MPIRSLGHSTSPYDAVMGKTGRNTGATDYDPPPPNGYGARGVIAGGGIQFGGGNPLTNQMQYITIATTGNATDYGDLQQARYAFGSVAGSESGRGVWGGGWTGSARYGAMDYKSIASPGNASNFGNLLQAKGSQPSYSNGIIGGFGGGSNSPTVFDEIGYITFATTGNATDFGDLTVGRTGEGSCSSSTRGVFFGGNGLSGQTNVIDYITIASAGNATDFGDVSAVCRNQSTVSNLTRGVSAIQTKDGSYSSSLEYITIASTGNASNFGSLSTGVYSQDGRSSVCGGSVEDRGLWYMGGPAQTPSKDIEYVTISSTGDSSDFGDCLYTGRYASGCSGPIS